MLIGISGAGKDTQAELLADSHGFRNVSTGELLRARAEQGDDTGKMIAKKMLDGFVEGRIVYQLLEEELKAIESVDQILFNAVVRIHSQVNEFEQLLENYNIELHQVIYLDLNDEQAIARLHKRSRKDDVNKDSIQARITAFRHEKESILDYYSQRGLLSIVDASGTINQVHNQIAKIIESI